MTAPVLRMAGWDAKHIRQTMAAQPPGETEMARDISTGVCEKLDITTDELNSLYVTGPVNGFVGTDVAARLAARFNLDASEPLGSQLAEQGILTDDEAEWFDDAE